MKKGIKVFAIRLSAACMASVLSLSLCGMASAAGEASGIESAELTAAAASQSAEQQELAKVAGIVKETLGIDNSYEDFYGEPYASLIRKTWNLNWSKDGERVNAQATSDGKVIYYNLSIDNDSAYHYLSELKYDPKFNNIDDKKIKAAVDKFLSDVLEENETAAYEESYSYSRNTTAKSFHGKIRVNGVQTPFTFRITVDTNLNKVIHFSRDDQSSYPGTLEAVGGRPLKAANETVKLLKSIIDFDTHWELNPDTKEAKLAFYPDFDNDCYVDAATGKLIRIKDLKTAVDENGSSKNESEFDSPTADSMAGGSAGPGLSEKELEGIKKLDNMLTKEEIDSKLRENYPELGLESRKLTLADIRYSLDKETGDIEARIIYSRAEDNGIDRRTVRVNGKTAELISVYGYEPYDDGKVSKTSAAAQKAAEEFAKKLWAAEYSTMALFRTDEPSTISSGYGYVFVQKEKGYFLPANSIAVTVSCVDNTIISISKNYTNGVKFADISNMISKDRAADIWANSYDLELSYIPVPTAIDLIGSGVTPLDIEACKEAGYDYVNTLVLGYAMNHRSEDYYKIDAVTGNLISYEKYSINEITYTDLDKEYADKVNQLAAMGIGFYDGKSKGDMTQLDMISLLATVDGYTENGENETEADYLYLWAYMRETVTKAERNDIKKLANLDVVKMLVNTLGYKKVASLGDIYTCSVKGFESLSEDSKGYVAIAQALGIIDKDFEATGSAARMTGLMYLYNYMENNKSL